MTLVVTQYHSILEFNKNTWNTLAHNAGPFLQFEFLEALERSGSVDNDQITDTGWTSCHLAVVNPAGELVGVVPGVTTRNG